MKFNKTLTTFAITALTLSSCSTNTKDDKRDIPINSLKDVLINLAPESKTFEINSKKETMLSGEKGTMVYIPADAFQFKDGSKPTGKLSIELKECYSLTEMIGESMNTTSDYHILETGGMIYFNATADGKQLCIENGKAFVIGFPKYSQTKEMDLFYNFAINDTFSTWIPDYKMYEAEARKQLQKDTIQSEGDIFLNYNYPIEMTDDLYDYGLSMCMGTSTLYHLKLKGVFQTIRDYIEDTKTIADSIAKQFVKNNWRVNYNLNIDKNGKMINFRVYNDEYTNYNSYALKVVEEYFKNAPPFDLTQDSVEIRHDWDYSLGVSGSRDINTERFKAKFREQFLEYKTKAIQQLDKKALDYYMFSATKMGWINCDRFWDIDKEKKTDFIVLTDAAQNTKVQIVFKDIKSIMTGTHKNGKIVFENVPLGKKIRIIGISYTNGKPTMGVAETTIDQDGFELTGYKEFSLDDLKKILNEN